MLQSSAHVQICWAREDDTMSRFNTSQGKTRWRWLASQIWRGQDDWVFLYRDSYPQSDIELIDRRLRTGYIEINGDLVRLTALGKRDLRLPKTTKGQSNADNGREARA
jgi:hypothetical protein